MAITAEQAAARVDELYARLNDRRAAVENAEAYFAGDHPLTFATPEWEKLHKNRYRGFADNWCGVVGSAPAERTRIDGFRLGGDTEPMSEDEKILWRDWEFNEGPAQSSQGFQTATVSKRSFALVWGDSDDNPILSWEHPSQVIVDYDPENRRIRRYALKAWVDGETEYATLYTATELWKFERPVWTAERSKERTNGGLILPASLHGSSGWVPRDVDGELWPLRNPLGRVPIVEYANRPSLSGGPVSDIEGTMAMQDAVNLLWAYLFVAADYASMPGRIISGAEPPKVPVLDASGSPTGNYKPVEMDALIKNRVLWLTGEAKPHEWTAAKLDVFTDTINVAIRHIAAQTRTPIYLIHGELGNVNGETLTGLDAPLVSKVTDAQTFYTASVRETNALMASVRGNEKTAAAARLGTVKWHNPALASEAQIADAALKARQVGMPMQVVLETIYGYGPEEVDRIMTMVNGEQQDPTLERVARSLGGQ